MPLQYPHLLSTRSIPLPGQFILGLGDLAVPVDWEAETDGAWTLAIHPALPRVRVFDGTGAGVGWLLGHAVTAQGELASRPLRLDANLEVEEGSEKLLSELAGRYILLITAGESHRLYPDPFSMLASVYSASARLVASTSALIPPGPSTPYDVPLVLALDVPYTNSMYPLGLTPRRGVDRVVPNHFLDLVNWRLVRRWPEGEVVADIDPATAQKRVADLAVRAIAGVASAGPVQCPLTAGRDSRLLLACSRAVLDKITFFTAQFPHHFSGGWRDLKIARAIAASSGLRHRVLPHRRARTRELREWVQRTGGEAGDVAGWRGTRTLRQVSPDSSTLIGWAGDIARPIYWRHLRADSCVTAVDVLRICGVPALPQCVARAERWLESVPVRNAITIMDLLLAEQRGGCWAGIIEYAGDGLTRRRLAPLCQQEVVRTLMRLPEEYRRSVTFERDVIALQWPELLEFPFNEQVRIGAVRRGYFYGLAGFHRMGGRAGRVWRLARSDPRSLVQKVRKRVSSSVGKGE